MFSEDQLEQLRSFPDIGKDDLIRYFTRRAHTRSDHLRLVAGYLGWKSAPADSAAMKDLEQFLLDRAMEHDSPALLCQSSWREDPHAAVCLP